MGFWTGIKHAINSTLGTTNFKPLDKIIDETDKKGKNFVIEESSPSIISSSGYVSSGTPKIINFYPQISGRVKISFVSSSSYSVTCIVAEETQNITQLQSSDSQTQTYELNISADKTYTFTIQTGRSNQPYNFNLLASILQYGYYNYEIN